MIYMSQRKKKMELKTRKEHEGGILYKFPDNYFFLNELGYRIIKSLLDGKKNGEIVDIISNEYNITKSNSIKYVTDLKGYTNKLLQNNINLSNTAKSYKEISYLKNNDLISPICVNLEITNRCNLSCEHCYNRNFINQRNNTELTTEEIKQIIDKLNKSNVFGILICGGEPLLREDIFEVIYYAKKKGFSVGLSTNGTLLNSEKINELLTTDLDEIQVSVDGWDKDSYLKIKGKDMFNIVLDSIKLLKNNRMSMHINNVLTKNRLQFINKMKELSLELDVPMTFSIYMPTIGNVEEHFLLDLEEIRMYSQSINEFFSCSNFNPRLFMTIDYQGNIYPCVNSKYEEFLIGNLLKQDLNEVWEKFHSTHSNKKCIRCKMQYY